MNTKLHSCNEVCCCISVAFVKIMMTIECISVLATTCTHSVYLCEIVHVWNKIFCCSNMFLDGVFGLPSV